MKYLCYILFTGGLLFGNSAILAQQRVDADLTNTSGQQEICAWYTTDIRYGELEKEEILLKELKAFQDGYAELTVDHFGIDEEIIFSLEQANNANAVFSIQLKNGNVFIIKDGETSGTNVGAYVNEDVFRIERELNKIYFSKNGIKYSIDDSLEPNRILHARLEVIKATESQSVKPHIQFEFPLVRPREFTQLKKQLDASYVPAKDGYLCFKYIEDYATVGNENDEVKYVIYDQTRTPQTPNPAPTLPNQYGVNWQILKLPNGLNTGGFYVLEVNGANKGEIYYLRFKVL